MTYVALMAFLLCLSGFFSGSETALFSLGKLVRRRFERSADDREKIVCSLLSRPRRTLITILIGNMFVNIAASAVATTLAIASVGPLLGAGAGVAVAVAVMTILLLIFGEVTPKALAVQYAEGFSRRVARPLYWFSRLVHAPASLLVWVTDSAVTALAPSPSDGDSTVTVDELSTLIRMGERHGEIKPKEKELIDYIFEFQRTLVREIMTPRVEMQAVFLDLPPAELRERVRRERRSYLPVYSEVPDDIVGVLRCKPYLLRADEPASAFVDEPYFIPETKRAAQLLADFRDRLIEFAVVLDEHGDVVGVVTAEDLLEELFGEVYDEDEPEEHLIVELPEGGWRILGKCSLDELSSVMPNVRRLEVEGVDTVGGFVMSQLGRIPRGGERFVFADHAFTVGRVVKRRVLEVEVRPR